MFFAACIVYTPTPNKFEEFWHLAIRWNNQWVLMEGGNWWLNTGQPPKLMTLELVTNDWTTVPVSHRVYCECTTHVYLCHTYLSAGALSTCISGQLSGFSYFVNENSKFLMSIEDRWKASSGHRVGGGQHWWSWAHRKRGIWGRWARISCKEVGSELGVTSWDLPEKRACAANSFTTWAQCPQAVILAILLILGLFFRSLTS